jgi:TonB family protein
MAGPETLLELTLASSVSIALVLLLRRPLRKAFGARVAYGAWGLVPVTMFAVMLPAATTPPAGGALVVMPVALPVFAQTAPDILDAGTALGAAWLLGAVLCAGGLAVQQWRFRRALGRLTVCPGGVHESEREVEGLPATFGLWSPRVVVPPGFESRFDAAQRELMLAHERAHVRRGDMQANAVAALLRCLFWFNPLLHLAAPRFRHDQELACDATVLAQRPQARRRYGEALLQAQLATQASPLGCHFGFGHPLKERIAMLGEAVPSTSRRVAGAAFVALIVAGAGFTAWAAQPPQQAPEATAGGKGIEGTSLTPPKYPAYAAEHNLTGRVVLLVDVAADGSVANAVIERSEPRGVFDEAALKAVKDWKFNPATKDGQAVAARVRVPVDFRPDEANPDGAPLKLPPGRDSDPASYDWIKHDPSTMGELRELQCDLVKFDEATGVSYCGIKRQ